MYIHIYIYIYIHMYTHTILYHIVVYHYIILYFAATLRPPRSYGRVVPVTRPAARPSS